MPLIIQSFSSNKISYQKNNVVLANIAYAFFGLHINKNLMIYCLLWCQKKNHCCCCCMYVVLCCWLLLYTSWYQTAAARLFTSELDWHQLPCLTHINGWFKFITFQCWAAAAAVAVHSTECQSSHHPRSTLETSSLPFLMLLTTNSAQFWALKLSSAGLWAEGFYHNSSIYDRQNREWQLSSYKLRAAAAAYA